MSYFSLYKLIFFLSLFKGINKPEHYKYLVQGVNIINKNTYPIDIILINVLLDACIKLKDGKIVAHHADTVESQDDPYIELTDRQKEICKLIKENPFISSKQMSVVLSVVHRTVQRDIAAMQKKGVLIREGNTSAGHWVLLLDI